MTSPVVGNLYKRPDGSVVLLLGVAKGNPTKVAYPSSQRFFPGGPLLDWERRTTTVVLMKVDFYNLQTQQKERLAFGESNFPIYFEEITT